MKFYSISEILRRFYFSRQFAFRDSNFNSLYDESYERRICEFESLFRSGYTIFSRLNHVATFIDRFLSVQSNERNLKNVWKDSEEGRKGHRFSNERFTKNHVGRKRRVIRI
ncbi:LOW QUALITY PROTEIN: hypothetical protein V1477_005828 [Vespula maculifrons]|uniref:Uncharacterized protein n=1 Tax=Vespula maculifrons TaxID=7453 RepID=A0ABD2CLE2_VESMC